MVLESSNVWNWQEGQLRGDAKGGVSGGYMVGVVRKEGPGLEMGGGARGEKSGSWGLSHQVVPEFRDGLTPENLGRTA